MRKTVRFITAFVNLAVLLLMGVAGYYINKLPDSYYVGRGENLEISSLFEVTAENSRGELVRSSNIGEAALDEEYTLKLFGVIPLKSVTVRVVDAPLVVPGGTPFGIKLLTDGVVVIGIGEVGTAGGPVCPAANAGIKTGDVIVTIKGKKVASNQDIADIISKSGGKPMKVVFRRNGREETALITPAYSAKDGAYKAGVWVRDSTAGIGTVTFYDPETGAFGGLGHPVCDADTGQILPLSSGEAVSVAILGVKKGEAGAPGELVGNFTSLSSEGTLTLNSSCGIFGTLKKAPSLSSPIPIAMRQDIRCGDADDSDHGFRNRAQGIQHKNRKNFNERGQHKEHDNQNNRPGASFLDGRNCSGNERKPNHTGRKAYRRGDPCFCQRPYKGLRRFRRRHV